MKHPGAMPIFLLLAAGATALPAPPVGAAPVPEVAPARPPQDPRFKTDLLVMVAHPDDETLIASYLARLVHDEHKSVAVIYATRGEGGGNVVGTEFGFALGTVREQEARRAMAQLGIVNVWFLTGVNGRTMNVIESLDNWHHGRMLEDVTRLVRLTRPEVILTWVPTHVIGQNHPDHQAAGVLGTEAFDLAGDPTAFPAQVADPGDRKKTLTTEGLRPWQAKKLYYFSDMKHQELIKDMGPIYAGSEVSRARGVPYYQLAAESQTHHLTQGGHGLTAIAAVKSGDYGEYLRKWREYRGTTDAQLIRARSHVGGRTMGDVFENVRPGTLVPFVPMRRRATPPEGRFTIALGAPFDYYRAFWAAHDIEHIARVTPPAAGVRAGFPVLVPLVLQNPTAAPVEVTLSASLPGDWSEAPRSTRFVVPARDRYPVVTEIRAPPEPAKVAPKPAGGGGVRDVYPEIVWKAEIAGRPAGSVSLLVERE